MVVFLQADGTGTLSANYDAWNRLTGLADGQNTVASYEYDGAGRRIAMIVGQDRYDIYFNQSWQGSAIYRESITTGAPAEVGRVAGAEVVLRIVPSGITVSSDRRASSCSAGTGGLSLR